MAKMVLSQGTRTVIELLAAEARIDGNRLLLGFCRRALLGDAESFVSCFRSMSGADISANWYLLNADTSELVDCADLGVTEDMYRELILESLLAGDTGIVESPNGVRIYAEVT